MMVDSDEICVGGSCDGSDLDRSLAWGCAAHSCRSAMAHERISGGGVCLFSKVRRLRLIHRPQQIQGKRLAEDPTGGRFTIAKECCSDSLKVETEPGGEPRGADQVHLLSF
ncbi:unnamed protein product [Brassica napus]|uniref:(rape) hypothetical protein n=1 Tax=Brassica napus TaxID=3708 RepID=A0A816QQY1_BRANA|nr:unnamed protein product [Brassica napus]